VIVVDDGSADQTAARALEAAAGDSRLRVVSGTEPQVGWAGKPWACARAAGEAVGELVLFVDADVVLHPASVRAIVGEMLERKVALASMFGSWELHSFWERVVIPAVGWLVRGAVNLDHVNDPGRPDAFANGQVIAVWRDVYQQVGGHGLVRGEVLEDVRLAEAYKRRGYPIGLWVAPWLFQVRLYRSLSEILSGYGKNLYEGMGRRPLIGLGAVLFIVVGTLLPFLALFAGAVARMAMGWSIPGWFWLTWIAAVCGLQWFFRWRLERRDGRSGSMAWAHPLANLVLIWILLRSMFSVRVRWKGRDFVDGQSVRGAGSGS
jgi:glycosyltransferase involved in cell wall biosynthesis